ncbi:MAG: 4-diphosphocytidyl-2-C-methyl-D-erythritol kinase [uncultured Thermomicrobiales bacterium]|uniref:4-diphosphocytidyl-2-C-methyl-D-erythritol kinase n=1 Tax=uncultured Thermomicrobiales bacterium TaxID=1645740 RepID=A0A6J4V5K1_9BACT|nr:MAG: 4-diphosphocytidyl-2-C-methyl-D-erythritol kinase [uncultured Thermomicrobiales bacterium]
MSAPADPAPGVPTTRRLLAPAKLNLGLEIVGRRPDGYHELVTIFQTIALYDELTIAPAQSGGGAQVAFGEPPLTLASDPTLGGEANLVLRAARALAGHALTAHGPRPTAHERGAALRLTKDIPVAAGLGGGSSDAAAALHGLRDFWGLGVPDDELAVLAARLGADVPFFLRGGTALAEGIGERITPLPPLSSAWFVTLTPALPLPPDKTRRLYAALGPADFGEGAWTRAQAERLRRGDPLDPALLVNSFARPLARLFPALEVWRRRFEAAGAPWVQPSGSGPTLYTMVPSRDAGECIAAALRTGGLDGAQVHVVSAMP